MANGLLSLLLAPGGPTLPPLPCPVCEVERDRLMAGAAQLEDHPETLPATLGVERRDHDYDLDPLTAQEIATAVAMMREVAAQLPRMVATMVGGTPCCKIHAALFIRWDTLDWYPARVIDDVLDGRKPADA